MTMMVVGTMEGAAGMGGSHWRPVPAKAAGPKEEDHQEEEDKQCG